MWRFGALLLALFGSALACGDAFKATGTGGSGAGTTDQPCTSVNDCELPTDPCIDLSCQNNRCTYVQAKDNSLLPDTAQIPGDCKVDVCLQGVVVTRDADDAPPSQDCVLHFCDGGNITDEFPGTEVECGDGINLFCDGSGQCVGCTMDQHCGMHSHPCRKYVCNGGTCDEETITNQPAPAQEPGDCKVKMCDATATLMEDPDASDPPDDANITDCEAPACDGVGTIITEPVADQTPCENLGQVCCSGVCCQAAQTCEGTPDPICT